MEFSDSEKTTILLKALDFNISEINRKEGEQLKLFEWSTSMLLAAFATIVALSGVEIPATDSIPVKILATILIFVPSCLLAYRIPARRKDIIENATSVEYVEDALRIFEDGYYGFKSPFPQKWRGAFPEVVRNDKMPIYFSAIISIMTCCVVAAIWLLL